MRITAYLAGALLALSLAPVAQAKVSAEEVAKLNTTLTPIGAERAANKAGTIPAWTGGLTKSPPCYKGAGSRLCDPYPGDKPLFTISAANLDKYKDQLSAGQTGMLKRYSTFKMNVYPTRRSAAYPEFVYKATADNALGAELINGGEGLANASVGFPFVIPKSGVEPVWNHRLRYRGIGGLRWNVQAAVTASGSYNLVKTAEHVKFSYATPNLTPEQRGNVLIYFLQQIKEPVRLAGTIILAHETMDQTKDPRRVWQYSPGQRRLRRAPNVGYDNPGTGADGLRTNDQLDTFGGPSDRYNWKLLGKREMYVPYNAYKLHSDQYKYSDILKPKHLNQDLPRYELHRVWVVEATVKPGVSHIYTKRVFYFDEDTWSIVLADLYDVRGQLWRWQEAHNVHAYSELSTVTAMGTVYDFQSDRYLALEFNNEEPETFEKSYEASFFDPGNVQKLSTQ